MRRLRASRERAAVSEEPQRRLRGRNGVGGPQELGQRRRNRRARASITRGESSRRGNDLPGRSRPSARTPARGRGLARGSASGEGGDGGVTGDPIRDRLQTITYETQVLDQPAVAIKSLDSLVQAASAERRSLPRLSIALAYAGAHAPDKAREFLSAYDQDVRDTARLRIDGPSHRLTAGHIALAEKQFGVAISLIASADTLYDGAPIDCESCILPELARAYDAARPGGRRHSDVRAVRGRHVRLSLRQHRSAYLGPSLERLGQLYEQKGNAAKAAEYYQQFVDLWKNAEPELQPRVAEAKRRLAKLSPARNEPPEDNMPKAAAAAPADKVALYEKLVATNPKVKRKGAMMPYTSLNGNMFRVLTRRACCSFACPTSSAPHSSRNSRRSPSSCTAR